MNRKVVLWSITVALAGFLFGFDTVVISGANLPIKDLWNTSPFFHGIFIMSMALWGTVIGALFGGIPCDKIGRKKTLIWIAILYFISALGSSLALEPYSFSFFRFIGGIGVGISSVACPTYISEISIPKNRGKLVATYQFNIVFGILIAFISNYLIEGIGEHAWRWMLGIEAFPALVYFMMVFTIPDSPRWLILKKGDKKKAIKILQHIDPIMDTEEQIRSIESTDISKARISIFDMRYKKPLLLAFLLAFFNQLSGINFVLYYAPEILSRANLAAKESLQNSISIGLVNLIFTILGVFLIDKYGRKQLMYIGSIGYIFSLTMVSWAFYTSSSSLFLLVFLLLFIASHAIGQGAVIWVYISEIFPNKVRAFGQSFGSGTHWIFAALITLVTPLFLDEKSGIFKDNPWPIFLFFSFMMIFQLLYTLLLMPETKGKTLEQLEEIMT